MSFDKKRMLFKVFLESQFAYSLLVWMFHSRKTNSRINYIHERASRLVYEDNFLSFEELLKKDNSFKIVVLYNLMGLLQNLFLCRTVFLYFEPLLKTLYF